MPELIAWVDDRRVGRFTQQHVPAGDRFVFEYDESATLEDLVSLTMVPLPFSRRFDTSSFPAAFDMILPEGERRQRIEAARKIVRTDDFALLSYVGANPVNRVRFLRPEADPNEEMPRLPTPREIQNCQEGQALFEKLMHDVDLRQGIAGVQPKVLGQIVPGTKKSPDPRQQRGSTHILKASTATFPYLAANESICLEVFAAAGLATPHTDLSADGELLLVERFDVLTEGQHLGFEEAAALMGETSATKYQRDYGTLIDVLGEFVGPNNESALRQDYTLALVLNWLLGNGDAHLKNFGVLYRDDLEVRPAPFYDCVATLPYLPEDVPALALSFDWYSKAWWPRQKIEEFAQTYGRLTKPETTRMFDRAFDALDTGLKSARRLGKQIPGFLPLSERLRALWVERRVTLRS